MQRHSLLKIIHHWGVKYRNCIENNSSGVKQIFIYKINHLNYSLFMIMDYNFILIMTQMILEPAL